MPKDTAVHELGEGDNLSIVSAALAAASDREPLVLVVDGRQRVALPDAVRQALTAVVDILERDLTVTITASEQTLSTQEAADLLRVSRTTLVRLLRDGEIPYTTRDRHRRIRLDDLLDYARRRPDTPGAPTDIVTLTRGQ